MPSTVEDEMCDQKYLPWGSFCPFLWDSHPQASLWRPLGRFLKPGWNPRRLGEKDFEKELELINYWWRSHFFVKGKGGEGDSFKKWNTFLFYQGNSEVPQTTQPREKQDDPYFASSHISEQARSSGVSRPREISCLLAWPPWDDRVTRSLSSVCYILVPPKLQGGLLDRRVRGAFHRGSLTKTRGPPARSGPGHRHSAILTSPFVGKIQL